MARIVSGLMLGASALALPLGASAATILSDPNINVQGQGFGNVHNLLTLQKKPVESGEVQWNGSANVFLGDADTNLNKSSTFLISDITTDPSRLGLVFNLNDSGGDSEFATMDSLIAKFYSPSGSVLLTAAFNNPGQVFPQSGGGVGGDGNPFRFLFSEEELATIAAPGVRIGLMASVSNVDAGPDTFIVAQLPGESLASTLTAAGVPLPASVWGGAALLAGLAYTQRLKKRKMNH